ncbi:MAG TPA: peptidylprolyl isomerase [Longimicrobiales bacterium]
MTTQTRTRAVALLLLAVSACARQAEPVAPPAPRAVQPATAYRSLDGLLQSPALQRVVEAQIDRDGDALIGALSDPDARVRARAAFALASVQDTSAVPALVVALADSDAAVRADAAHALGQTPAPAGARALLERIRAESDSAVHAVVLDALGRAGGAAELDALADAPPVEVHGDAPALAAPLALAFARFGMRGHHDERATDWLIDALRSPDRAVRANAAYAFARASSPDAFRARRDDLLDALDRLGPSDRAAMHLLTALGRLQDPRDVGVIVASLGASADWAVRVNAVRALGRMAALAHDGSAERGAAIEAAQNALVRALDDRSHHVRRAAADALAAAPAPVPGIADRLFARLTTHAGEPAAYGPLLVAIARAGRGDLVLDRWLALTDPALRRYAIASLALVPGSGAFDQLAAAAASEDVQLAAAAVSALATRRALDIQDARDERYFEAYATALRTRDLAVAYSAASALADSSFAMHGAGPLIQSVLLQMRAPDDNESMVEMIRALGVLRDETAVPLLRELRAARYPELRTAAAAALALIAGEPATLPRSEPAPTRLMQWDWLAQWGTAPRLRLETTRGTIVLELSPEQAPLTTQTMLTLAAEGRFDDTPFHRVVGNFVIQGGDVSRGDGWGGPGFAIRSELTRIPYLRGTAGVASSGKDTEGSQWFVTHSMQPHLDLAYSAFGTIVDGLDVVDEIREGDRLIRAIPEPTQP